MRICTVLFSSFFVLPLAACAASTPAGNAPVAEPAPTPAPTPTPALPADVPEAPAAAPGDDDCTRANAATGEGIVDAKATGYRIDRQTKERALVESFEFEGFKVTSTQGGCAHASHVVVIAGKVPQKPAALATLLANMPIRAEAFIDALRKPEECGPAVDGTLTIACGEFGSTTLQLTKSSATLAYDFAL